MLALLASAGPAWSDTPRDYPLGAGDAFVVPSITTAMHVSWVRSGDP